MHITLDVGFLESARQTACVARTCVSNTEIQMLLFQTNHVQIEIENFVINAILYFLISI